MCRGDKNIQIDVLNLAGINLTTPFTPVVYAASSVSHSGDLTMSGLAGQSGCERRYECDF